MIHTHNHEAAVRCPQNCPSRYTPTDVATHEFLPPTRLFTCAHPESAKNCVTEHDGIPTHAHTCDECVPDNAQKNMAACA